jgi:hypothetical protein
MLLLVVAAVHVAALHVEEAMIANLKVSPSLGLAAAVKKHFLGV